MTDVSMLVAEWETEIAGLRAAWEQAVAERDGWKETATKLLKDCQKAEAESARLRTAFEKYLKVTWPLLDGTEVWAEASAALKPDTGEKP